jgi:hypothetical protein
MPDSSGANRPARTVLEQLIRDRRQTLEEFAAYAETFAREHREPGTLSVRHLQRLIAGRRSDGRPLGSMRPATARLLERIFDVRIAELLAPPERRDEDSDSELRGRLRASGRVDFAVISLLYDQLSTIRRLDRQLGAAIAHEEVCVKARQVTSLLTHSLMPDIRARLAALLAELYMLAGWQALDRRNAMESWQFYERAKNAAMESNSEAFIAHTAAQQGFVLIDIEKPAEAVGMLGDARRRADKASSPLLRSWIAAAHGETLAADNQRSQSLAAFDEAANLLSSHPDSSDGPYVALDRVHLDRWRGHALSRLAEPAAVELLTGALDRLDPTFARAETALRVDLASVLSALGENGQARLQAERAGTLAAEIGSVRQLRRVRAINL